ncbi:FAD-binding protein [Sphingobacterium multivorum]|nr:FAD-binding protein [Sphingobacterium multivorum]
MQTVEQFKPDVIIIGAGLAGLTAAMEVTNAGKKVLLVDQETAENLGGQAYWSFGGFFLSIHLNNVVWASRILLNWLGRTGWELQDLTARRIIGRDNGQRPT